jgi:hypothetical protein
MAILRHKMNRKHSIAEAFKSRRLHNYETREVQESRHKSSLDHLVCQLYILHTGKNGQRRQQPTSETMRTWYRIILKPQTCGWNSVCAERERHCMQGKTDRSENLLSNVLLSLRLYLHLGFRSPQAKREGQILSSCMPPSIPWSLQSAFYRLCVPEPIMLRDISLEVIRS